MTWQWLVLLVMFLGTTAALVAWWMWLVHDSEPTEEEI